MKKKKKKVTTLIVILILILIIIGGLLMSLNYKEKNKSKSADNNPEDSQQSAGNSNTNYQTSVTYRPVTPEDYINLEEILKNNEMIQKLPDDAKILLSFYNFDTGERQWEKSYILTRGDVEQVNIEDYDIKLTMHSKYLTILNDNNLCSII